MPQLLDISHVLKRILIENNCPNEGHGNAWNKGS